MTTLFEDSSLITLAQASPAWYTYRYAPALIFAFCFGACVGSFINVVVYRLPAGISIISPPSRCPTCGARLTWRQNLPILGWLFLRGKCHYCDARISPQYMLVELFVALLFVALTVRFYVIPPGAWSVEGVTFGPWWKYNGIWTLPAFITIVILFASLVAMTLIDARTFTIPIEIPIVATIVAFLGYGVEAVMQASLRLPVSRAGQVWPLPLPGWTVLGVTIGGLIGLAISYALLRAGKIRYSFADYEDYLPKQEQDKDRVDDTRETGVGGLSDFALRIAFWIPPVLMAWFVSTRTNDPVDIAIGGVGGLAISVVFGLIARAVLPKPAESEQQAEALAPDYPHGRREMFVELKYLAPCIGLMILGGFLACTLAPAASSPPIVLGALGACGFGYIVGGGLVWMIRILGTLGFGREAMGMGDVHLLAAVGAVLGWRDPIFIFFGAAFVGIAWAAPGMVMRQLQRELPYGPHLAVATLLVLFAQPLIYPDLWLKMARPIAQAVGLNCP